ncbi:MAG TPA: diguanylate cyclase [Solirubrobacteraceae bacterium]|jgi:GGDEF domain-containing protein
MSDGSPSTERLARAARAAHDLSDALWETLHEELAGAPHTERTRDLAQRLADVCSTIALLAAPVAPGASAAAATATVPGAPATSAPSTAPATSPLEPPEPNRDTGIEVRDARPPTPRPTLAGEPIPADEQQSLSPWITSIGRRLERHREDRLPFAVLLVEIVDFDRLAQAESQGELARLTDHVERAIGAELRPADLLTREAVGRYWLVTPETDTPGARNLAERLARTVRLSARHRGVPLELAVGIAVCPEDGRDAAALAAHADVGVYAARAAGRPVAPADDPAA